MITKGDIVGPAVRTFRDTKSGVSRRLGGFVMKRYVLRRSVGRRGRKERGGGLLTMHSNDRGSERGETKRGIGRKEIVVVVVVETTTNNPVFVNTACSLMLHLRVDPPKLCTTIFSIRLNVHYQRFERCYTLHHRWRKKTHRPLKQSHFLLVLLRAAATVKGEDTQKGPRPRQEHGVSGSMIDRHRHCSSEIEGCNEFCSSSKS